MPDDHRTIPANDPNEPADDLNDELVDELTGFDELLRNGALSRAMAESRCDASETAEGAALSARDCLVLLEQVFPRHGDSSLPPGGRQIGRFELIRILGQGGFGTVYLARDPRLSRLVALKVPRLHTLGNQALHERFLREARAAAALDHPNIVPILETGEAGPVCYLAAAYCEGPNLAQWLQSNSPVKPRLAARIIETLAGATHYSHSRGILHRDLKPSNVLLGSKAGDEPPIGDELPFIPRITDFGLARFVEDQPGETGSALLGTPLYMAPEQTSGNHERATAATDVYSLGVILYELLTGRPPFQGTGFIDVLNQIQAADPVSPSRLIRSIPRDLETICLKCLARDPSRRYPSAGDLQDDLRAFREGRSIAARPVGVLESVVKGIRRRPLAASLTFVVVGAIALLYGLEWKHSQTLAENLAVTEALRVEGLAREADLILQFNAAEINAAEHHLNSASLANFDRVSHRLDQVRKAVSNGATAPPGLEPEWDFVMRQLDPPPPERILNGHAQPVYSLAISPDGQTLASGDAAGGIRIWNLKTGEIKASFTVHRGEVRALAFSPQGDRLASGGQHRELMVWDTSNWRRMLCMDAHEGTITTVDWRRDGKQIASGGRDGHLRIWQANDLSPVQSIKVGSVLNRIRYVSDGTRLISSQKDNSLVEWILDDSSPRRVERLATLSNPLAFDWMEQEAFGLTTGATFFTPNGKELRLETNYTARAVVLSRAGHWGATGGGDGFVDLWRWGDNPWTAVSQQRWRGHSVDGITDFVATSDGSCLITAGQDGLIKIWRIADFNRPTRHWLGAQATFQERLDFSQDSLCLAVPGVDGRIRVYRTVDGSLVDTLDLSANASVIREVNFSPDGEALFAVVQRPVSGMIVWRPCSSSPHQLFPLPETHFATPVSERATMAVAFLAAQGVGLIDTSNPGSCRFVIPPPYEVADLQLSSDGRLLAVKPHNESSELIRLINVEKGTERNIPGTLGAINGMVFDREGRFLAIIHNRNELQLIDVAAAKSVDSFYLEVGSSDVHGLCFSPDGQLLAFGVSGRDRGEGCVQLLHVKARRVVLTLKAFGFGVDNVRFSPDGRTLACVTARPDSDGNAGVVLWRFDPPRSAAKP